MIRPEDIFHAIGALDEESVFNAKATKKMKRRHRPLVRGLLAAAIMVICCVTAGAIYISHQKTVALMETGVQTGGYESVEVDDTAIEVIDEKSVDYNTAVTDSGTTVTMDSVMGLISEDFTLCYITLTIEPPERTALTADMKECSFMEAFLQPEDASVSISGGGTATAIDNGDGTYSAMLMWQFHGSDLRNIPMKLELRGFGNVSKEVAGDLYSGNRDIEIPGSWVFHFDALPLEETVSLSFDPALFADEKIHPSRIELSSFGAIVTYTAEATDVVEALGLMMTEKYPELDVDWRRMDLEILNLLCAEGSAFTEEQQQDIEAFLADFGGIHGEALNAQLTDYRLLYQDGSVCKTGSEYPDWTGVRDTGESIALICFDAPVDLSQLAFFEIGSVQVPIQLS